MYFEFCFVLLCAPIFALFCGCSVEAFKFRDDLEVGLEYTIAGAQVKSIKPGFTSYGPCELIFTAKTVVALA